MSIKDVVTDKGRPTVYASALLVVVATALSAWGWGTYDPATRIFYPPPIPVDLLVAYAPVLVAPGLAFVAWLKGWARR